MKVMLDIGAYEPIRAHETDAGLDIRTPITFVLCGDSSAVIDTGIHIELPHGTYGKIESKSGLNVRDGVVSLGGVIDEGYTGSIKVKIYNMTSFAKTFQRGDKIAQLLIIPCLYPAVEIVDKISGGERGADGFGSTGR